MSSIQHILTNEFLTFIVPNAGPMITKRMTISERNKIIIPNGNIPAYATINNNIAISISCEEDYRSTKNEIYDDKHKNVRATIIANSIDTINNHCILGNCAFTFDDDNDETRNLIKNLRKNI